MPDLLFIGSIAGSIVEVVKEKFEPIIPAENWANKELYHQDMMNGMSIEQRMKGVENGRYKLTEKYPEPHRDPVTGKIVIENCKLHERDLRDYGAYQTYKWAEQGKYNLTPEELEKERERIKKEFEELYELRRKLR